MPTAMYSIYATVGLHVTVPRMPVLQLYESLKVTRVLDLEKFIVEAPIIDIFIFTTNRLYVIRF